MPKDAGDSVGSQTDTIGYTDSDGNTSAGEAVAIATGEIEPADSDAGHALLGVRSSNRPADDTEGVHVRGIVIAQVAAGVTAGEDLDVGNATDGTVGKLAQSSGGPAHALSDEGGTYKGESLDANEAAVLIR